MSLSILRLIARNIQETDFFTVMADECADISNKEQLTICFRWVDAKLEVHEEFVGLYNIPDITAHTIVAALRDCVCLNWSRCRGQCFDGASNMSGHRSGVATQISSDEPRALFTHCYGHSLNLAMCDTIKGTKLMRDVMDVTYEISKLIKYSPKRNAQFNCLKDQITPDTPGFRVLRPTGGLCEQTASKVCRTTTQFFRNFGCQSWMVILKLICVLGSVESSHRWSLSTSSLEFVWGISC